MKLTDHERDMLREHKLTDADRTAYAVGDIVAGVLVVIVAAVAYVVFGICVLFLFITGKIKLRK